MIEARLAHGESEAPGDSGYADSSSGRKIFISWRMERGRSQQNSSNNFSEEQLLEVAEEFGQVVDMKMFRTETGESKEAAFVTFSNAESAEAALALNGTEVYPGHNE